MAMEDDIGIETSIQSIVIEIPKAFLESTLKPCIVWSQPTNVVLDPLILEIPLNTFQKNLDNLVV